MHEVAHAAPPEGHRQILFVRQRYAQFGGGEIMLDNIMTELALRQQPVAILSSDWPQRDDRQVIHCAAPKFPRALRARFFARSVCEQVSKLKPLLVQSNDRIPCCDVLRAGDGVHAAYLAQRRRLGTKFDNAALHFSLFHREMLRLERKTYESPRLKAVIAISKMVAEDISFHYGYPAERVHHIPNGIDLNHFSLNARREHRSRIRGALNVGDGTQVILFVGSGFARKGLLPLMKAVAELDGQPELWVIGQDPRAASFKQIGDRLGLNARLRMLGPQKTILPWYGAADIATLPSIYDPFGTVAIEAMACGLPTVVSNGCGARELVDRFDGGLVCDIADASSVEASLRRALRFARRSETLTEVRAAAEHYDFQTMVASTMKLYDSLLTR